MSEGELANVCPGREPRRFYGEVAEVLGHESAGRLLTVTDSTVPWGPGGLGNGEAHVCRHCRCVYWEGA